MNNEYCICTSFSLGFHMSSNGNFDKSQYEDEEDPSDWIDQDEGATTARTEGPSVTESQTVSEDSGLPNSSSAFTMGMQTVHEHEVMGVYIFVLRLLHGHKK